MRAVVALLLTLSIDAAAEECAPARMIRMETVDAPITVEARKAPQMSRVIYRIGSNRMRVEEILNPATGLHLLFIIDTPDVWTIDLAKRSGEHGVDPDGASSTVQAPLFDAPGLPEDLVAVEVGCELAFIAHPQTSHEPAGSGERTGLKHFRQSGSWRLTLLTRTGESAPMAAMLSKDGKVVAAIRYRSYAFVDAIPVGLFAPPDGIAIREAD
jgi:hypothetical protein